MGKKKIFTLLLIPFFVLTFQKVKGQNVGSIHSGLINLGLENIIVRKNSNIIMVQYENRRFRFEGEALFHVLKLISQLSLPESLEIIIFIQNNKKPITKVNTSIPKLKKWLEGEPIVENLFNISFSSEKLNIDRAQNSSLGKIDLALGMKIDYLLGNYDNPIRSTPQIPFRLNLNLLEGLTFNALYNIILHDDLYYWETSRWRELNLSYSARLTNLTFARVSGGYYSPTQFGAELYISKFIKNDKLRIDLSVSKTENKFLDRPPTRIAIDESYLSYFGSITYRTNQNVEFSISHGKYIFDRRSSNFKISKQFGESTITGFLRIPKNQFVGSGGILYAKNYGFAFSLPFGSSKHMKASRFRLRTEENFFIDYNYTGGVDFETTLNPKNTIQENLKEYYPSTLIQHLKKKKSKSNYEL